VYKLILVLALFAGSLSAQSLQPCVTNTRYFCANGAPVLLTGSHVWNNLYDLSNSNINPPPAFDYAGYLDFLQAHHHNFIRLWSTDGQGIWWGKNTNQWPWLRLGPGTACDGKAQFDLSQFDPAFFARLRNRVLDARARGIYVSVMLFEGVVSVGGDWCTHPFAASANVNGINGDTNGDGHGSESHTLAIPDVVALEEAYVRHVVDTVNDLDNVLYEIVNEDGATQANTDWQYHWINFIHAYEATLPSQHPIGMTWQYLADRGAGNTPLRTGPADWISPGNAGAGDYVSDPLASDGSKVVVVDTDHLNAGSASGGVQVWKNVLRGNAFIYMDGYDRSLTDRVFAATSDESMRRAMGDVQQSGLDLLTQTPQNALASTGYCLCSATRYATLALLSGKGKHASASVTLQLQPGVYTATWLEPNSGQRSSGGTFTHNGGARLFTAPASSTYVLLVSQ
jgi:hypothetical protein